MAGPAAVTAARDADLPPASGPVGHDNMLQLVQLRWLAVAGQLVTIFLTHYLFGIRLPIVAMLAVLAALVVLNGISMILLRSGWPITNRVLFAALLLDVAALSIQLYLSGGATNPFVSLFLLQVVLGAILVERWSSWALVAATSAAFALLTRFHRPIALPESAGRDLFALHIDGMWVCFALVAVLLVMFVTRINANLRAQDRRLADIRRQAVEEEHIVRIGLLASGAAHELGTPLSSLSVILGDWRAMPGIAADADLRRDVEDMQDEVRRCKAIVTGILLASGDPRGEATAGTTVRTWFAALASEWERSRDHIALRYADRFGADVSIAADVVLQQAVVNLLDNAAEASAAAIDLTVERDSDTLVLTVSDDGRGFAAEQLMNVGKPYNSSKGEAGHGLGLFLVSNVVRKLGGVLSASNRPAGAAVVIRLPLDALRLEGDGDGR